MIVWDHWHIEPSSICTLQCPRCPRTEVPDTLLNRQLTLRFFQQQMGADVIKNIRKITFCGNDGDPIYCRELVEICAWIKEQNPHIHLVIVTNGSHKKIQWWRDLAQVLDEHDEINWSIDGWDQHSNSQYRVNCDWSSMMDGYAAFVGANHKTYRVWAAIAFRFNQDHLPNMQTMAQSLAFDLFQLTKSTKFGSHYPMAYGTQDPLCPDRADLVSSSHRFERTVTQLTARDRPSQSLRPMFIARAHQLQQQARHSAICMIGNKGVFLNSKGEFYPCCWTATRYAHNDRWHQMAQERFDLNRRRFRDVIDDEFWRGDFLSFDSHECRTKCTRDRLNDIDHVAEW